MFIVIIAIITIIIIITIINVIIIVRVSVFPTPAGRWTCSLGAGPPSRRLLVICLFKALCVHGLCWFHVDVLICCFRRSAVTGLWHSCPRPFPKSFGSDVHTHAPAQKPSTNFMQYPFVFVLRAWSASPVGHGHGYECHSQVTALVSASPRASVRGKAWYSGIAHMRTCMLGVRLWHYL